MPNNPVIEMNHVTKEFRLGHLYTLKETLATLLKQLKGTKNPQQKRQRLIALDNIHFQVEKGEVLGLIGENGAGKSTLLKMLARVSVPTKGSVKVRGSVAPLIEVGAGFHPELTGRENIYLNGAILGIPRKTIRRKFKEIVEFAELERFIDTPVKYYSSGMAIRLGFSVATSIEAEVLIIDEVLAVGDLAFQRKCFDRMENLIKRGDKTVLIVSHNIRQIERLCSRALLLSRGKVLMDAAPKEVCQLFYERSNAKIAKQTAQNQLANRHIRKTGEVEMESLELLDKKGRPVEELTTGQEVTIRGVFNAMRPFEQAEVVYGFHTTDFVYISSMSNAHLNGLSDLKAGKNSIECVIPNLPFVPGIYCLRVNVFDKFRREMFSAEMLNVFTVKAKDHDSVPSLNLGFIDIPAKWQSDVPHQV